MKKNKKKNRNRTPNLRIHTCDQTPMTSHHFYLMTIFLIYLKSREMDTFMKWLLYCVISYRLTCSNLMIYRKC